MEKQRFESLADILTPVADILQQVDDEIKVACSIGYGLSDKALLHLYTSNGKKIRAALVILSAALKGTLPDTTVQLAAGMELFHGASLTHDDVIDQTDIRRGQHSVSHLWGNKLAILVGDLLYTKALTVPIEIECQELLPMFIQVAHDMIKGELIQVEHAIAKKKSETTYYKIIELKTASFMALCTRSGGTLARFNEKECKQLYDFGLFLGYAYQIVDDVMEFFDQDIPYDKANDYLNGNVTLPVLLFLKNKDAYSREIVYAKLFEQASLEHWDTIKRLIKKEGILENCVTIARQYIQNAQACLAQFPDTMYKKALHQIADFVIQQIYCMNFR